MYIIYGTASLCQREFKPLQSSVNPWNPLESFQIMPKTQFAINYLSKIKILLGASQLCNEYKYLEQKCDGNFRYSPGDPILSARLGVGAWVGF